MCEIREFAESGATDDGDVDGFYNLTPCCQDVCSTLRGLIEPLIKRKFFDSWVRCGVKKIGASPLYVSGRTAILLARCLADRIPLRYAFVPE